MIEKVTPTRTKRYSTLFGVLLGGACKLALLSLLAWILLLLALSAVAMDQGREAASARSHFLLNNQTEFIASKQFSVDHVFLANSVQLRAQMEYSIENTLTALSSLLQKMTQRTVLNVPFTMTIVTMLADTLEVVTDRLWIFILSIPLWASLLFVMTVDGLGQRDIRKFQAARESTFLFHRLKLLTSHVFYGFFLFFMSTPWVIEPSILLLPMILTVSILLMLSIKYYKKYL